MVLLLLYNIKDFLNGKWELYIAENNLCSGFAGKISSGEMLKARGSKPIEATVPGNFELDMQKAGLIEEPFYAENPLEIQKLENRHLWYRTYYNYSGKAPERAYLRFDGIDTFSDIYLNGNKIGSTDNMFISHEFRADGIKAGENEVLVHIKPTVIEARKYDFDMDVVSHLKYNAASLSVRKAAHSFGWDIMPRFISGGIWRSCFVIEKKPDCIDDIFLSTAALSNNRAVIYGRYSVDISGDYSTDYSLKIKGKCGESTFEKYYDKLWHTEGTVKFEIEDPELWWARNMGEPKLYEVTAELYLNGNNVDIKKFNFGVRIIKLIKSDITDEQGSGNFLFEINGEKIYIRGTNWVPLDAFHSRDTERLNKALDMLIDVNCNAVRCWGGNVYEDHNFFDFCDKNGILVWQDFAMACATYPNDEKFCAAMAREAEAVVKNLRQHPSIAVWAGDNECDESIAFWEEVKKDPNKNKITRRVIPDVLQQLDPYREYLPSSPYVSEAAFKAGDPNLLPEKHLWGPRDYFKGEYYTTSFAHFASEIGYHGCPAPESLKKFISPEKLWPWQDNNEWLIHSTCMELDKSSPYAFRNGLMANQIKVLFGEEFDDLETFSLASQLSQAEALKLFIEQFRSEKWRRTGLIWWNLLDGWPQISDAVTDYYYNKKIAYYFIKRSQEPVALMIREPADGKSELVAVNEFLTDKTIKYNVTDISNNTVLKEGKAVVASNGKIVLDEIPFVKDETHFYVMEWEYDGLKGRNHYISGKTPYNYKQYTSWLKEAEMI